MVLLCNVGLDGLCDIRFAASHLADLYLSIWEWIAVACQSNASINLLSIIAMFLSTPARFLACSLKGLQVAANDSVTVWKGSDLEKDEARKIMDVTELLNIRIRRMLIVI